MAGGDLLDVYATMNRDELREWRQLRKRLLACLKSADERLTMYSGDDPEAGRIADDARTLRALIPPNQ